jgi:hypothetical protein
MNNGVYINAPINVSAAAPILDGLFNDLQVGPQFFNHEIMQIRQRLKTTNTHSPGIEKKMQLSDLGDKMRIFNVTELKCSASRSKLIADVADILMEIKAISPTLFMNLNTTGIDYDKLTETQLHNLAGIYKEMLKAQLTKGTIAEALHLFIDMFIYLFHDDPKQVSDKIGRALNEPLFKSMFKTFLMESVNSYHGVNSIIIFIGSLSRIIRILVSADDKATQVNKESK